MARTQRLNLCEALNYVLAGYQARPYNQEKIISMQMKDGKLTVTKQATLENQKKTTRMVSGDDFEYLSSLEWHAGDDKTIKGRW